jgi:hypothetical protein
MYECIYWKIWFLKDTIKKKKYIYIVSKYFLYDKIKENFIKKVLLVLLIFNFGFFQTKMKISKDLTFLHNSW